MAEGSGRSRKIRENIEASMEASHKRYLIQLQEKRIEYAKSAREKVLKKKPQAALTDILSYLKNLEITKKVGPGGLHPSQFDSKKEIIEMMTVSSMYWELVIILDRYKSDQGEGEFQKSLEKLILFTRDQPYKNVLSETLRKFIRSKNPNHRKELKTAYKIISGQNYEDRCFILGALEDEIRPDTLPVFRGFRDEFLKQRPWGRNFVAWYYHNGPSIARHLRHAPKILRQGLARGLDCVGGILRQLLNCLTN